jgi:splicing factor 3A subunit 1
MRLSMTLPNLGDDNPGMEGQTRTVEVSSLQETVGALKQQLAELVSVPPSKQKLSSRAGFLKDQQTLAYYNVLPGETLVLSLKERGGKKK